MNAFNSIKFRFTLWYLVILALVLLVAGAGIYITLSQRLHTALDDSLTRRARQIAQFRDIISIVAGGTFEGEPGEGLTFYYRSGPGLAHISAMSMQVPADAQWITRLLEQENGHTELMTAPDRGMRICAQVYLPENPIVDPNRFDNRQQPRRQPPPRPGDARRPPPPPRPQDSPGQRIEIQKAVLVVARPTQPIQDTLDRLLNILLLVLPLTLCLAGAGGIFLLDRVLKPVNRIRETARHIRETDLSRRIPIHTPDELGHLSRELNRMIERMEAAFLRQKQLTADASHELRTPLAVMKAEATLALSKNRNTAYYRDTLATIAKETDHMERLITQLLTLARFESGKDATTLKPLDLGNFLKEFCRDIFPLCQEKGVRLKLRAPRTPATTQADPNQLRQLLSNLTVNALRHTPKNGAITITLKNETQHAKIAVTDTGTGIPRDALPHIFKRFFRVDKSRSRQHGGSGLGLAICKHIAQRHGGTIHATSREGQGTTFTITLPISRSQSSS